MRAGDNLRMSFPDGESWRLIYRDLAQTLLVRTRLKSERDNATQMGPALDNSKPKGELERIPSVEQVVEFAHLSLHCVFSPIGFRWAQLELARVSDGKLDQLDGG